MKAIQIGRVTKKDISYVKLSIYGDWVDVLELVVMAGINGEEAACYMLYHVRGSYIRIVINGGEKH